MAGLRDDLVDEAVVLRLVGGEPAVAVRVPLDALDRLAGVKRDPFCHHPLQVNDLLRLDRYVRSLPLHLARRLVHQDAGVRQGIPLTRGPRAEEELAHRGSEAHANRGDIARDVLHGVVDGQAGRDRAAGRVYVKADVADRVLRCQQEQLGADQVRRAVLDLRTEKDDPLAQQPLVDVCTRVGPEAPGRLEERLLLAD